MAVRRISSSVTFELPDGPASSGFTRSGPPGIEAHRLQPEGLGQRPVFALGVADRRPPAALGRGAQRSGGAEGAQRPVEVALDARRLAEPGLADDQHVRVLQDPVGVHGERVETERRPPGQHVVAEKDTLGSQARFGLARVDRRQMPGGGPMPRQAQPGRADQAAQQPASWSSRPPPARRGQTPTQRQAHRERLVVASVQRPQLQALLRRPSGTSRPTPAPGPRRCGRSR